MSKWLKEIIFSVIAMSLLMTILQTPDLFYYFRSVLLFKIFFLVSIPIIGKWIYSVVRDYRQQQGIYYYCVQKFRSLSIPKGAKYAILIVLFGNLIAIGWGKQRFPFYDVGMFRYPVAFKNRESTYYELKYYYWQQGQYKILELRKECLFLLAEHFGLGYTHDLGYGTAYFHKGEKENFKFLSELMKEKGIDTLWVGVHEVNFKTHAVSFDPDICNAIHINQRTDLYYGPIYIPDYQIMKCDAH